MQPAESRPPAPRDGLRRHGALLLVGLVLAACWREPAGAPGSHDAETQRGTAALEIPSTAPLVAFLGDSIAAGLHLATDAAFPAVLQRDLAQAGHPFRLVNAGVSGDTSSGGLRRVDWLLKQRPDVLVVELGGNDGLRGEDTKLVESNLRGIVQRAKDAGARVLLLGMRLPPSYGAPYVDEFAAIYPRIADEMHVALVPYFMSGVGGIPEMTLPDGLHPTERGHSILAANVAPTLAAILGEISGARR